MGAGEWEWGGGGWCLSYHENNHWPRKVCSCEDLHDTSNGI